MNSINALAFTEVHQCCYVLASLSTVKGAIFRPSWEAGPAKIHFGCLMGDMSLVGRCIVTLI